MKGVKMINIKSVGAMEKIEKEENKAFNIDRVKEDEAVVRYQQTGDVSTIERLYEDRVPSLQFWTSHFYYLMDNSKDDMFGEFRRQFMRAIIYYDKKRGHFNTCLYTFIRNCIINLIVSKHAKKRCPEGVDFDFNQGFVTSLNKKYDSKNGDGNTLLDVISNQLEDCNKAPDKMSFNETLNILSNNDSKVKGFLKKIGDGFTLAKLIKECKTVTGSLHVKKNQYENIKSKKGIINLIKTNNNILAPFKLLDYEICEPTKINYRIEMRKSKEADLFLKTIRKLRKNSGWYMSSISA